MRKLLVPGQTRVRLTPVSPLLPPSVMGLGLESRAYCEAAAQQLMGLGLGCCEAAAHRVCQRRDPIARPQTNRQPTRPNHQVSAIAWMSMVMSAFLGFLALTVVIATFYGTWLSGLV